MSAGAIRTWWYPLTRSTTEKNLQPCSFAKRSRMESKGYLSCMLANSTSGNLHMVTPSCLAWEPCGEEKTMEKWTGFFQFLEFCLCNLVFFRIKTSCLSKERPAWVSEIIRALDFAFQSHRCRHYSSRGSLHCLLDVELNCCLKLLLLIWCSHAVAWLEERYMQQQQQRTFAPVK